MVSSPFVPARLERCMPRPFWILPAVTVLMMGGFALAAAPATPEVMIFLHDGTDVTGRITKVTDSELSVNTNKGKVTIPRKKYQGMVLNTPEQKKMADKITTDPEAMIAYGLYSQK